MTRAQRGSMGWAAAAAGLMLLCLTPGHAEASRKIKVRAGLTATDIDPNAQGQLGFAIDGHDGTFELKVNRLDRRAGFDVVVNGVKVASLQTSGGGGGHLRFRTRPSSKDLVLGFDPRGAQLSVRNGAGHDVLVGSVPAPAVDPTATACCVPDGNGGSTCQELTADACTAATGTASQQATCLPDPCTATPPPTTMVCCTNETGDDESESECEDQNAADCATAGGMVVEAAACDPNPCVPVPPPPGDAVACCVTHENDTECEVITTEACTASNGTPTTSATCEPDPCVSAGPGAGNGGDGGDDGNDNGGGDANSGGDKSPGVHGGGGNGED